MLVVVLFVVFNVALGIVRFFAHASGRRQPVDDFAAQRTTNGAYLGNEE